MFKKRMQTKNYTKIYECPDSGEKFGLLAINGDLKNSIIEKFQANFLTQGDHIKTGGTLSNLCVPTLLASGGGALGLASATSDTLFMATANPATLMAIGNGVGSAVMGAGGIVGQAPFIALSGALMPVVAPLLAFQALSTIMVLQQFKTVNEKLDKMQHEVSRILQRYETTFIGELISSGSRLEALEKEHDISSKFTNDMAMQLALIEDKVLCILFMLGTWGQVATIIVTTVFIFLAGNENWQIILFVWALVPLTGFIMFFYAKMPPNSDAHTRSKVKDLLLNPFYIFALIAIMFGGATEVCMNQWASTFMNDALKISKITGDLLGMCGFAIMLGLGRTLYGIWGSKFNLNKVLVIGSGVSVLCYIIVALSPFNAMNIIACALTGFFCSLLWPGVIVVSSKKFPLAGAWMFAVLAAAGDIGAAVGPYITGVITEYTTNWNISQLIIKTYNTSPSSATMRMGILFSLIFPLITFISHIAILKLKNK